jgi:rhodanese-related sulfurtransferase
VLSGLTPTAQWDEVEIKKDAGFSVVDVRTAEEFALGTIPGAINMPIDEIRERINQLPTGKLLITCQVGQRGHAATRLLKEMGYEAINLDGGYLTWSNSPANKQNKTQTKEKVNI